MRLLLALLFALPGAAFAVTSVSLLEAENLWRSRSHEVNLAMAAARGAEADLRTAGQMPNPNISLNAASISPQEGVGAGHLKDKRMDSILRLEQLIERGGKRDLRVRGAEARLTAARYDLEEVIRTQRSQFRRAYYDLMLAQEKLRLAEETQALYERGQEAAQRRLKAGDIAPVDVSRMAIDKARAENDLRLARSDLEQAQQALAYFIGRDAEAPALRADDVWPVAVSEALVEPDLAQRPDLKASSARVAAADADRELARALRTRDVNVGVQVEHNLQNPPSNSFGVGVSIPLFAWHGYEGEVARAESDYDGASVQEVQQRALAQAQIAQARSALLAARDRLLRFEGGLLGDAERVAKTAELAYNKGAMGLMDLLDARRTVRQVRLETAVARADYAKALSDWQLQVEYGKAK